MANPADFPGVTAKDGIHWAASQMAHVARCGAFPFDTRVRANSVESCRGANGLGARTNVIQGIAFSRRHKVEHIKRVRE